LVKKIDVAGQCIVLTVVSVLSALNAKPVLYSA